MPFLYMSSIKDYASEGWSSAQEPAIIIGRRAPTCSRILWGFPSDWDAALAAAHPFEPARAPVSASGDSEW
jgi:hypothetical protein